MQGAERTLLELVLGLDSVLSFHGDLLTDAELPLQPTEPPSQHPIHRAWWVKALKLTSVVLVLWYTWSWVSPLLNR